MSFRLIPFQGVHTFRWQMAQKQNGLSEAHGRASVKWQQEQRAKKKCRSCGKPAGTHYLCPKHRKMERDRKKARRAELRSAKVATA